ncbi:GIP [Symbiodinium microadriaticum]|nr:GIP [Symbiodinium microadriaticum]
MGKFRDKRLRGASIPFEGGRLYLRQHRADENVWSVVKVQPDSSEVTVGYVNIYVDDILYMGEEAAICAVHSWLTQEWKASPLTWASTSSTIRFLGLEIGRTESGGVRVHQRGYIEELLRHHDLWKAKGHTTPCPQEWLLGETELFEKQHTPEQLRRAQALTGELLWLSGKSRPDLLHTVATMSALCLKDAELVEKIGLRALGYLKNTIDVELYYKPESTQHVIVGYSDASFAPQGSRSFGCSVACYLNQPISWRCGRQSLIALSVAEAELIEAINAVQMMQGLAAFTGELHDEPPRMQLRVDNSAAVGLSSESAGTWKTRHLRVRAYHLREAVRLKQLSIVHVAGVDQLGDLGTKAFHRPRLQQLLHLWGLRRGEEENEVTPSTLSSMRRCRAFYPAVFLGETYDEAITYQVENYMPFRGPFVMSEHGDRVHFAPSPVVRGQSQATEQSRDPPLFGSTARRIMESWPQRAPLLYGQQGQGAGTDADSSGSIPREMVQEEVRRQVTEALDSQKQAMQQLLDENHRLRSEIAARPLRVEYQEPSFTGLPRSELEGAAPGHGVPGDNPDNVMEYLRAIHAMLLQVKEYLGAIHTMLLQVMEYLGAIRTMLLQVMEYLGAIRAMLLQVMEYLGAIQTMLLQVRVYLEAIQIMLL